MWETIRGYLTFTRKERYGVLFLLLLISLFFVLPYFLKRVPGERDPTAYNKLKEDIRKFETRTSDSAGAYDHSRYGHQKIIAAGPTPLRVEMNSAPDLFYFDPNKLRTADWLRLGLTDRLSETIRHYVEKGGRFQKAEDLKKLYGLQPADYERLFPYVRIGKTSGGSEANLRYTKKFFDHPSRLLKTDSFFRTDGFSYGLRFNHASKVFVATDVNESDSTAWSRLPGIGVKLASRIVRFREKLGGFYQIDQVAETFGMPDSTFQKMKPYLRIHSDVVEQIDINTATKETLIAHPYIRWKMAQGIIAYRLQHGSFQSVDELLQLAQTEPAIFEKLKHYLVVGHQ